MPLLSLFLAVLLALVHLVWRLPGPSSATGLSLAGGVSVGYVFVHLLPGLNRAEMITMRRGLRHSPYFANRVYILALLGLVAFYQLQRMGKLARKARGLDAPPGLDYWLLIAARAALSLLVGYLLVHHPKPGTPALVTFCVAMFAHFTTYDAALRRDYGAAFKRWGRWVLAGAVILGWLIGVATRMHWTVVAGFASVLAGTMVFTALREDVPAEEQSTPWAFALGAGLLALAAGWR